MPDDSGFLALIDPDTYPGFVAEDWDYDSVMEHFAAAMAARRMLLWHTGDGGWWHVEVSDTAPAAGFRRTAGPIRSAAAGLVVGGLVVGGLVVGGLGAEVARRHRHRPRRDRRGRLPAARIRAGWTPPSTPSAGSARSR
ncbi:hypothetical protein GCM10010172_77550 [Paractinoplanes ferrugineus]|uniref:Uncharacterized protein n=1 Tax=Paractinoplanes ferrugineus TaxID=113564 RepID=A0A919MEI8_9ACTN|nr:hypothetical protein [Actinoplanes ferrugineus]GIE12828.1 hypothetical protein Afe05nite_46680 [Actinoplanes ferrugineus]